MGGTATMLAVLWTACGLGPAEDVVVDEVDLIEVNHFHDDQGRPVFDQIIYYDWSSAESRYQVRAWRMLKSPAQIPRRSWRDGGYVAIWHDSQNGDVLRKVIAQTFRESYTQFDPELVEREFLPKEKRRELQRPVAAKAQAIRKRFDVETQTVSTTP